MDRFQVRSAKRDAGEIAQGPIAAGIDVGAAEPMLRVMSFGRLDGFGITIVEDHALAAVRGDTEQAVADHARDPNATLGIELEPVRKDSFTEFGDGFARAESCRPA